MNNNYRQLTRSTSNRMIAGVCAGLGEYLGIDPTIVRLLAILAFTGPGEQRLDEWRRPRLAAIRHGWCPHC